MTQPPKQDGTIGAGCEWNGGREMKLKPKQVEYIQDVIYTLTAGNNGVWNSPESSLQACIDKLISVRNSIQEVPDDQP